MQFPTPPQVLYKYRTVSKNTKSIFTRNQLWYSSIIALNDPFDCCFTAKPNPPTRDVIDLNRNQFRLTAFTEANDNLIMWAHYADYHRGVCLGFSFPPDQHKNLWKIEYLSDLPCNTAECSGQDFIRKVVTTKSVEWGYEQEWRLVAHPPYPRIMAHSSEGMAIAFPAEWLAEVYLGCRMSQADKDAVIRWTLNHKNPNLKLFLAKPHPERFALIFQSLERG